jgi:hypothetical protein
MLHKLIEKINQRFSPFQIRMLIKLVISLFLIIISLFLFMANSSLLKKNTKMIKLIKRKDAIHQQLNQLILDEKKFKNTILAIQPNEDIKKLEAQYLEKIKQLMEQNKLKVDSFAPKRQATDGFEIFRYNIKASGDFISLLNFFVGLKRQYRFIYVKNYDLSQSGTQDITATFNFELIGAVQKPEKEIQPIPISKEPPQKTAPAEETSSPPANSKADRNTIPLEKPMPNMQPPRKKEAAKTETQPPRSDLK